MGPAALSSYSAPHSACDASQDLFDGSTLHPLSRSSPLRDPAMAASCSGDDGQSRPYLAAIQSATRSRYFSGNCRYRLVDGQRSVARIDVVAEDASIVRALQFLVNHARGCRHAGPGAALLNAAVLESDNGGSFENSLYWDNMHAGVGVPETASTVLLLGAAMLTLFGAARRRLS